MHQPGDIAMQSKIHVSKPKVHARKKSMLLILTLLLSSTVYAQGTQLQVRYDSPLGVTTKYYPNGFVSRGTRTLDDANGDGISDLIMTTETAQGHLQDLLVVLITPTQEREYWRVDNVPATLGLGEDVEFIGFTNAPGDPVRHGIFVGNLTYLVNPLNTSVSWADDNGVPSVLGGVFDLTKDGFDDLVFFLPDTQQVRVWSIDQ